MVDETRELDLHSLSLRQGQGISDGWGKFMYEAASACLENQGHKFGVRLKVDGAYDVKFSLLWQNLSQEVYSIWQDSEEAIEYGAYGISILLMIELTEYKFIERSYKGTGFDFWLGTNSLLFQQKARLEVSGILNGDEAKINIRAKQKLEQTTCSDGTRLPVYIVIVEFGTPRSKIIRR